MKEIRRTPTNITELQPNEIFVFGSNLNGDHAGGAAKIAKEKFGAIQGQAIGIQGQSYAIPTLDNKFKKLAIGRIEISVKNFLQYAAENSNLTFLVTPIGTGIAGFSPEEIAPMFKDAPENVVLPASFSPVKGYKIFNPNMTCRNFQYEVGKTSTCSDEVVICNSGIHFCLKASDCFSYYSFDKKNIVCEVEALGDIVTHSEDSKIATNKLHILRKLTWEEVLFVANEGSNNTGHSNTGYSNTGDRNTGYSNTGDSNTGDRNTGAWNTGYSNTGYSNTGDRNTGAWNTGDSNTGYSNTGDRNTGAFCTGETTIKIFNKPSKWTDADFRNSNAFQLLNNIDTKQWIPSNIMSEAEKEKYPSYKTCEGYLKDIPFKESFQNAWNNWSAENRNAFTSLPNFDKKIFFEITGVKVK